MATDPNNPPVEVLEGRAAFAERALEVVKAARVNLAIFTYEFDRHLYGTERFVAAVRKFVLQNDHTRLRVLVHSPGTAASSGHRLVEFGRALTTHIEFRELLPERQELCAEYLIADERALLVKGSPEALTSRYFADAPLLARMKLREFDPLWNEAPQVQGFRNLQL